MQTRSIKRYTITYIGDWVLNTSELKAKENTEVLNSSQTLLGK